MVDSASIPKLTPSNPENPTKPDPENPTKPDPEKPTKPDPENPTKPGKTYQPGEAYTEEI